MIKTITIGIASILIAAAARSPQSTTNSDRNVNGQQILHIASGSILHQVVELSKALTKLWRLIENGLKLTVQRVLSRRNRLRPRPRQSKRRKTVPWSILSIVDKTRQATCRRATGRSRLVPMNSPTQKLNVQLTPRWICASFLFFELVGRNPSQTSPKTFLETTLGQKTRRPDVFRFAISNPGEVGLFELPRNKVAAPRRNLSAVAKCICVILCRPDEAIGLPLDFLKNAR